MDSESRLENVNSLRLEIDALDIHIQYLKDNKASALEIGAALDQKERLVEKLDKILGYWV